MKTAGRLPIVGVALCVSIKFVATNSDLELSLRAGVLLVNALEIVVVLERLVLPLGTPFRTRRYCTEPHRQ